MKLHTYISFLILALGGTIIGGIFLQRGLVGLLGEEASGSVVHGLQLMIVLPTLGLLEVIRAQEKK